MNLYESINNNLKEADEKKFRVSWGSNRNLNTGDFEDSGSFDIMAKDEDDATDKAYKELDARRIPYDEFNVSNISDAETTCITYSAQRYKDNGLPASMVEPETRYLYVIGKEDDVKRFAPSLVGKFIVKNDRAYKCLKILNVAASDFYARDDMVAVDDPKIFDKLANGFKPFDLTEQKSVQNSILNDFKEKINKEHKAFFEMDDSKISNPKYIGTLCLRSLGFTNGDRSKLEDICKAHGCTSRRDYDYEDSYHFCFIILKN